MQGTNITSRLTQQVLNPTAHDEMHTAPTHTCDTVHSTNVGSLFPRLASCQLNKEKQLKILLISKHCLHMAYADATICSVAAAVRRVLPLERVEQCAATTELATTDLMHPTSFKHIPQPLFGQMQT
jgi:hypothetical protein